MKSIEEVEAMLTNEPGNRTKVFEISLDSKEFEKKSYTMFVEGEKYLVDDSVALTAYYYDQEDDEFSDWAILTTNLSTYFGKQKSDVVFIKSEGIINYLDIAKKAGIIKEVLEVVSYGPFDAKAYRCVLAENFISKLS